MIRYVAKTGHDTNDGLTRATAWLTIAHALTQDLEPGTKVKIGAGTYTEAIGVTAHGTRGAKGHRYDPNTWILVRADDGLERSDVVVNGVGNRATFYCSDSKYIRFSGFTVKNDGGASFTPTCAGFEIGNAGGGGPTSRGAHHIEIDCHVQDVNRNAIDYPSTGYGAPIYIYGQANTLLGGTATHHISLKGTTIGDSWISRPTLLTSHVTVSGCVKHVELSGLTFVINRAAHDPGNLSADVSDTQGGIECGGNQLPGAYPDQPFGLVITDNIWTGNAPNGDYAIYVTACKGVLIERNYLVSPTWGIGVVAERGANPGQTSEQVLCRNNIVQDPLFFGAAVGAFDNPADNYDNVTDVWFIHNTLSRTAAAPASSLLLAVANTHAGGVHGVLGLVGESFIGANIVTAVDNVLQMDLPSPAARLFDHNLWASNSPTPFLISGSAVPFPYDGDQDTNGISQAQTVPIFAGDAVSQTSFRIRRDSAANGAGIHVLPSWAVAGAFGDYDPHSALWETDTGRDIYKSTAPTSSIGAANP